MYRGVYDGVRAVKSTRISEAYNAIRTKDVRSATLERLRLTWEAHELVEGLPQQLKLGEGYFYILDRISLPISPTDLILGRVAEEIPDAEGEELLSRTAEEWGRALPPWMMDGGHECFDWARLLSLGLSGLEEYARKELDKRIREGETGNQLDFLRGAVRVYQAIRNYVRRYGEAARQMGLDAAAEACEGVADEPAHTFREALQLIWLVGIAYCSLGAVNATLTFGRMDELLLDFYRNDLEKGTLTRTEAGALIEDFYCKNNLILGRGEHQMSSGSTSDTGWLRNPSYDSPQYMMLGGRYSNGGSGSNELTELFVERIVAGFENPVIVFRYFKDVSEALWLSLCRKIRDNASILIYNDEAVIPAMIHSGIESRDAMTYAMYGCNWPTIPGIERGHGGCGVVLPDLIRSAVVFGDEPRSIHEVYERLAASVREVLDKRVARFLDARRRWEEDGPGDLRIDDCFLNGPVTLARSWRLGSVKYATFLVTVRHIGSAADCMAAVDDVVFRRGLVSVAELRRALSVNFEGSETLRQSCLQSPKFGQDDDTVDGHAKRILETVSGVLDEISRVDREEPIIVYRSLTTDMTHLREGERLGATPDGRLEGTPLSDNSSPYPGSCTKGITAMFCSLAKLPLTKFNSGASNVRIQPSLSADDTGLGRLAALLRTYFDMGGLQVQVSLTDTEELLRAQTHPEEYRDLMVRITGYSAVFVDMSQTAQDEIIRREMLTMT